jgi:hypothetical protein
MSDTNENKPFDKFELAAAILLGLGAVGASVAGYQSGLWGGASVEGYGASASMTTKASTTYNDELTSYIQDAQTDVRAKEMIWEAMEIEDEDRSKRLYSMASWLYVSQLTDPAYDALKLPKPPADKMDEEYEIPAAELEKALQIDLRDDYEDELFGPSEKEFQAAEKRFDEGRVANEIGDKFSLASVILTVALFFGGLALVFKTKVRWGFLGTGFLVTAVGVGYMATLQWA